jgi:hypothetical protein
MSQSAAGRAQFSQVSFAASATARRHKVLRSNLLSLALGCWDASVLSAQQHQQQRQPPPAMQRVNSRTVQSSGLTSSASSSSPASDTGHDANAMAVATDADEDDEDNGSDNASTYRSMLALLCSNECIPQSVRIRANLSRIFLSKPKHNLTDCLILNLFFRMCIVECVFRIACARVFPFRTDLPRRCAPALSLRSAIVRRRSRSRR